MHTLSGTLIDVNNLRIHFRWDAFVCNLSQKSPNECWIWLNPFRLEFDYSLNGKKYKWIKTNSVFYTIHIRLPFKIRSQTVCENQLCLSGSANYGHLLRWTRNKSVLFNAMLLSKSSIPKVYMQILGMNELHNKSHGTIEHSKFICIWDDL